MRGPGGIRQLARQNGQPANGTDRMITNMFAVLLAAAAIASATGQTQSPVRNPQSPHPVNEATRVLHAALASESRWIKVHAAEALLACGGDADRDEVRHAFERELAAHGSEPEYRIGIWRVLAQAASGDRDAWVRRIADAFLDTAGPDRLHASESLGKLGYRARADEIEVFERAGRGGVNPLAANALWVLVNTGRADAEPRLADLLTAGDVATRATAAYAVRHLQTAAPATWTKLTTALTAERANGLVRASLAAAAFVQAPSTQRPAFRYALEQESRGDTDMKSEVCGALAMAGESEDVALLTTLLANPNVDVRIGAARALLEIDRRSPR
jgi:hypothetical protein